MGYKTTTNREFKEKGFYNPDEMIIVSTNKNRAGAEYNIKEALERLSANDDEIEITIKKSETIEEIVE